MRSGRFFVDVILALAALGLGACEQKVTTQVAGDFGLSLPLGGATTVAASGRKALGNPAANIPISRRPDFFVGNAFFNSPWVAAPASVTVRDGLGPNFNARSCDGCHNNDGRGRPPETGDQPVSLVVQLSYVNAQNESVAHPLFGANINPFSVQGLAPEAEVDIEYEEQPGHYGDGTSYSLRRPKVTIRSEEFSEIDAAATRMSARVAQSIVGVGLLESVPAETLAAAEDPDDTDGDGISGRINWVSDGDGEPTAGRFGWKANVHSVRQQTANALFAEMGIASSLHPEQNCAEEQPECRRMPSGSDESGLEISDELLDKIVFYQKLLAVPAQRDVASTEIKLGAALFNSFACDSCHTPVLTTDANPEFPELAHQTFRPYTDLLIHDMGEGLADGRPDQTASGSEWRTAPLWGLGHLQEVNQHQYLLHDGRARGFAEAILWHAGEAERAREAFRQSGADERRALIAFLESL